MPSIIKLGKNKINALTNAPPRNPSESVASKTGRVSTESSALKMLLRDNQR